MHRITAALLALAATASAGLPTSGLPAGKPDFALHLSNETLDQTQVGKALTGALEEQVNANAVVAVLRKELGFVLDEDFRDLTTVGNVGDRRSFVTLVRGKFNRATIEAFASRNNVPSRTVRGLKAWDVRPLAEAVAKAAGKELGNQAESIDSQLVIVNATTVVIADAGNLEAAVAAAAGTTPWKNTGLARAAASVQNGWLLVAADVAAIEDAAAARRTITEETSPEAKAAIAKRTGAKLVTLAAGENNTDVMLRVLADFVDEASAKGNIAKIKGWLGLATMLTMPTENDTPDMAARKADGAEILRRITITQQGASAEAKLDYPIQKVAQSIVNAAKTSREKDAKGK